MDTGSRKWGSPYLTRECFSLLGESMADQMLLVLAKRAGRYIAGALNFIGADTLYGRYWGGVEDHPFLHFEVCYYQAIDFAIAHGSRASRPARKARTSSPAAICRARPIARTTSPTRPAPRRRRLSQARAARRRPRDRAARRGVALSQHRRALTGNSPIRFRHAGLVPAIHASPCGETNSWIPAQGRHDEFYSRETQLYDWHGLRSGQHLRQDPAGRDPLPQDLRGRGHARLPRHHAAHGRPRAGHHQGEGARPVRHRA